MYINRDWSRSEHDDYTLNIQSRLSENNESVSVYYDDLIVGWKIQPKFE